MEDNIAGCFGRIFESDYKVISLDFRQSVMEILRMKKNLLLRFQTRY